MKSLLSWLVVLATLVAASCQSTTVPPDPIGPSGTFSFWTGVYDEIEEDTLLLKYSGGLVFSNRSPGDTNPVPGFKARDRHGKWYLVIPTDISTTVSQLGPEYLQSYLSSKVGAFLKVTHYETGEPIDGATPVLASGNHIQFLDVLDIDLQEGSTIPLSNEGLELVKDQIAKRHVSAFDESAYQLITQTGDDLWAQQQDTDAAHTVATVYLDPWLAKRLASRAATDAAGLTSLERDFLAQYRRDRQHEWLDQFEFQWVINLPSGFSPPPPPGITASDAVPYLKDMHTRWTTSGIQGSLDDWLSQFIAQWNYEKGLPAPAAPATPLFPPALTNVDVGHLHGFLIACFEAWDATTP